MHSLGTAAHGDRVRPVDMPQSANLLGLGFTFTWDTVRASSLNPLFFALLGMWVRTGALPIAIAPLHVILLGTGF